MIGPIRREQLIKQLLDDRATNKLRVFDIDELLYVDAVNVFLSDIGCTCADPAEPKCWFAMTSDEEQIAYVLAKVRVRDTV